MLATTEKLWKAGYQNRLFSIKELAGFLGDSDISRDEYINQALKKGEIIRIKHGVYMLAPHISQKPNEYHIANQLIHNSYISYESALSYHQWIPELVTVISSAVRDGKSVVYQTPLGLYEYQPLPINPPVFLTGVSREGNHNQPFFMATGLRALADLVYARQFEWECLDFLTEGLRIDEDELNGLKADDFDDICRVYHTKKRVFTFLQHLRGVLDK